MQDFETLYDEKISSIQGNEIVDEYFMSLLRTHSFVELLKSLYYSPQDADISSIYLKCMKQGYRMCDLQRAFCILVDEWYDGPICFIAAEGDNKGDIICVNEEPVETIPRFTEEYYLRIRLISEEDVIDGETNSIKIESNLFSARSIFSEVTECTSFNIDQNDVLSICYSDVMQDNFKFKLNANNVAVVRSYNSVSVQCLDGDLSGDFYYSIINAADELFIVLEKENCLMRIRQYIDGLNAHFDNVRIERFISDKNIVSKCNQSGLYKLCDFLECDPTEISTQEMFEIYSALQQVDTTLPIDIFNSWINKLLPREYYVLKKRYLEGHLLTLESVGEICNVTRERIRQVEQKAIRNILSPKRNKYRNALVSQLKLFSPHKSYITFSELEELELGANVAIFLDKTTGDIIYESGYKACFFSRDSKNKLDFCLEELPNEFTKTDLQEYSILISEKLNNAFTANEITELICSKYRICGEYIAKSRMTLKVILSFLMQKYFPDGMDIYEDANIDFLREKAYIELDGFELADNNRAVRARLQAFCVMVDRGVWKYDTEQILISNDLQWAILDYIKQYNSPVLPIQAIMDMFSAELGEIEIYNKYSLHSQLKKILPAEYSINRDYVMKSSGDTFYSVIEAYVKQSAFPVTKRDIQSNFPGATDIVIQQMAAATKVINMNGYYVHLDNLGITDEEVSSLKYAVDSELSDKEIHHANIVFSKIKGSLSGLFNRIGINHYLQFYYLLRELFPNEYEYNRPFMGALGVEVINGEAQVINLIMRNDECSISDIRQFAKEVGTIIDRYIEFIDRNNDAFIFKNRETVISVNAVGLDEADFSRLDAVLEDFIGEEQYKLLSDFYNYRELPDLACLWNTWLLYSIIKKYSKGFKLVLTSNFLNEAKPILVRQEFDESNIDFRDLAEIDQGDSEQFDNDEDILDTFDYDDLE